MKTVLSVLENIYPIFVIAILTAIISEINPERGKFFSAIGTLVVIINFSVIWYKNEKR